MREQSNHYRRTTTVSHPGVWITAYILLLIATTGNGRAFQALGENTSSSSARQNVVQPTPDQQSENYSTSAFAHSLQGGRNTEVRHRAMRPKSTTTPTRIRVATLTPNAPLPHRLPSIGTAVDFASDASVFVQVDQQTPIPTPQPPASTPPAPNTTVPPPLPPEPAGPVSSTRPYLLDRSLFPELRGEKNSLPGNSGSSRQRRGRDPQAVRKNSLRAPWQTHDITWLPTDLSYAPLYFDDERLERHGHSLGFWQPAVSGVRFFATIPALPYLITQQPPGVNVYPLGQTRPGDQVAPYHVYPRFNWKAAFVEAGGWIGFFALFP